MKVVAIVQARMGSTRLPGKVLKPICGKPMIGLLLERLEDSKEINEVIVATTINSQDDPLVDYVKKDYRVFRGNESFVRIIW